MGIAAGVLGRAEPFVIGACATPRSELRFLTVAEVADQLRASQNTVRDWARAGVIHTVKIGGLWRIPAAEIDRLTPSDSQGDAR